MNQNYLVAIPTAQLLRKQDLMKLAGLHRHRRECRIHPLATSDP